MSYTIEQILHAWVKATEREWAPPAVIDFQEGREATPHKIQRYFEASATGRWVLSEWTPDSLYCEQWRDKPWQSWCGLLLGYTGTRISHFLEDDRCPDIQLHQNIVDDIMPGTDRLYSKKRWRDAGLPYPDQPGLMNLSRGDIITVGDASDGSHIAQIRKDREPFSDTVKVYEGNSTGRLSDGTDGEGVVRDEIDVSAIKQTYRLKLDHFTGTALP